MSPAEGANHCAPMKLLLILPHRLQLDPMANVIWISPSSRLQRTIRWKQNRRRTRLRSPPPQGRNPSPKSRTSGGKNSRQSRSRPHLPLHPRPQARSPYPQSRTRGKKISRSITITPTPLDASTPLVATPPDAPPPPSLPETPPDLPCRAAGIVDVQDAVWCLVYPDIANTVSWCAIYACRC